VLLRKIGTDELTAAHQGADDVIFERLLKNEAQEEMKKGDRGSFERIREKWVEDAHFGL